MTSVIMAIGSWLLLLGGSFFILAGSLGLIRMPDFYTRNHAVSITDTAGAGLLILGLIIQSPDLLGAAKLILIMLFLLISSPTATHALAKAALHGRLPPVLAPTTESKSSSC